MFANLTILSLSLVTRDVSSPGTAGFKGGRLAEPISYRSSPHFHSAAFASVVGAFTPPREKIASISAAL